MNADNTQDPVRQKAVALQQKESREAIPRITATGAGKNAEKILALAFASGVKVRTDEDLVNMLSAFDVDSLIPLQALEAVSEILSHVYQEDIRLSAEKHNAEKNDEDENIDPVDGS